MKTAGERAFANIMACFSVVEPMVVLCGSGNNGGDGYVVARCGHVIGLDVVVVQASAPKTKNAIAVCQEFIDGGGRMIVNKGLIVNIRTVTKSMFWRGGFRGFSVGNMIRWG